MAPTDVRFPVQPCLARLKSHDAITVGGDRFRRPRVSRANGSVHTAGTWVDSLFNYRIAVAAPTDSAAIRLNALGSARAAGQQAGEISWAPTGAYSELSDIASCCSPVFASERSPCFAAAVTLPAQRNRAPGRVGASGRCGQRIRRSRVGRLISTRGPVRYSKKRPTLYGRPGGGRLALRVARESADPRAGRPARRNTREIPR